MARQSSGGRHEDRQNWRRCMECGEFASVSSAYQPLSQMEVRVALLVAEGWTNGVIAARLHYQRRSVENLVARIGAVLQIADPEREPRVMITRWVLQRGFWPIMAEHGCAMEGEAIASELRNPNQEHLRGADPGDHPMEPPDLHQAG